MNKKIAVIGSGMAGLASGWFCRQAGAEVTILESRVSRGMDSFTEIIDIKEKELGYVDVPLRVMSPHAWPNVLKLCDRLNVKTFEVDTQIACSWLNSKTWFRSSKIQLGSKMFPWVPINYILKPETYRLLWGFIKLFKSDSKNLNYDLSLREFSEQYPFDPLFWKGLLYPLLITISTSSEKIIDDWPANQIIDLLRKIVFGARLRRIHGGTKSLAEKLGEDLNWENGIRVEKLEEKSKEIFLHSQNKKFGPFDYVICAVQANHLKFLPEQYSKEMQLLSSFPYDSGTLWVHSDTRFMPKNKKDWCPLHYQMDEDFKKSMFSVWVNPIEPSIAQYQTVLQTWNPIFEPRSEEVIAEVPMERAVVNKKNKYLLNEMDLLQKLPSRKVFFCGSYASPGVPLLESAVLSAIKVVRNLGFEPSQNGVRIFEDQ